MGKLVLVNRKARMGRNPATGASIKIPAKRVLKFRVAKAAKDACRPIGTVVRRWQAKMAGTRPSLALNWRRRCLADRSLATA